MKNYSRLIGVATICVAIAGCSTPGVKEAACIAAGALVGGAATRYGTDDNDAATAAGAILGGVVALHLCKEEAAPPAPMPKPIPKPEPKPEPAPEPMPDPDTDGDGVLDKNDDCPGTPAGTAVDSHGCPEIPNLQGVHFELNKAQLTSVATAKMREVAGILESNPHVGVHVVGHTDSSGSNAYNLKLSQRRAQAVGEFLRGEGVSESRITTSGRGEDEPVADNATKAGRAENRRVELTARPLN